MTGSDWSNQRRTSQNGTDEYKTTESQSQGVIAPTFGMNDSKLGLHLHKYCSLPDMMANDTKKLVFIFHIKAR